MRTPTPTPTAARSRSADQATSTARPAPRLYRPLSALVLRAPLLPTADHRTLASGTGPDGLAKAWADPSVRLAVAVASPDLAAAIEAAGPERATLGRGQRPAAGR
jgi:hypothetical protein